MFDQCVKKSGARLSCVQPDAEIVMHPRRGSREKKLPAMGLLFVNPSEAVSASTQVLSSGGKKRFLFNSVLCVDQEETFFVSGPAMGAPMAVLCLEKLIALGAQNVIQVGWCGALRPGLKAGTLFLPGQACSGEGTSLYYSEDLEPYPSPVLSDWLRQRLELRGAGWEEGRVWSTDAPYRESRPMLERLRVEKSIAAIDMEYSALCSVACFRGIDFAACMLVSDEIWHEQWRPGFSAPNFRQLSQEVVAQFLAWMRRENS